MSSRKKLKKEIDESMILLYNDCILYKSFSKNANQEKVDAILQKIVELHKDLLKRVSSTEGKYVQNRVKSYFKKLRQDLQTEVNAIGKDIQALD